MKLGGREKLIRAGNVIEAWQRGGVALHEDISTVHNSGTVVDVFEFKDELKETEFQAMAAFMVRQIGKPYAWSYVLRFVSRREPASRWSKAAWFCSEVAFEMALTGSRVLLDRIPAYQVSPRDVVISPMLWFAGQEITK